MQGLLWKKRVTAMLAPSYGGSGSPVEQSNELTGPPGLLSYARTIAPELHSGTLIFDHRIVNSE